MGRHRYMVILVFLTFFVISLLTNIIGPIVPVIVGRVGEYVGLRSGVAFLYLTFGFVFSIGFWAKPLVNNATLSLKKAEGSLTV